MNNDLWRVFAVVSCLAWLVASCESSGPPIGKEMESDCFDSVESVAGDVVQDWLDTAENDVADSYSDEVDGDATCAEQGGHECGDECCDAEESCFRGACVRTRYLRRHLTVGERHACVVQPGGSVACWGARYHGESDGVSLYAEVASLQPVGLPLPARMVAAGRWHTCALLEDGSVWCWGRSENGQLGSVTEDNPADPVQVVGLPDTLIDLATGGDSTCAVAADGAVLCWGASLSANIE